MSNELPTMLTTGQIARLADPPVNRSTVHRWVSAGLLRPHRELNGVRYFRRADVERFLRQRTTSTEVAS